MKFKTILLAVPLLLVSMSGCNDNNDQGEVISARRLTLDIDPMISYLPLNSEYMPGDIVKFEITSNKLSYQEFKVYLNDELLIGMSEKTYQFTMPNQDSTLKAELKTIKKDIILEETGLYKIDFKDNKTSYTYNEEVFFNVEVASNYIDDYELKGVEAYYEVNSNKTSLSLTHSTSREYQYSFSMPQYDVCINPIVNKIAKYNVTIQNSSNIEVKLKDNKKSYKEFDQVSFSLDIKNDAILKSVEVIDSDNDKIATTLEGNIYSFYIGNKDVTIIVQERSNVLYSVFSDVAPKYGTITFENGNNEYHEGDKVRFKVNEKSGYKVRTVAIYNLYEENIGINPRKEADSDYYYFTMVEEDIYIRCEFDQVYYVNFETNEKLNYKLKNDIDYFSYNDKVEFDVEIIDEKYVIEVLSITYTQNGSTRNIDYEVVMGTYSFIMPEADVYVVTTLREIGQSSKDPFNNVTRFQTEFQEYDLYEYEYESYYETLTWRLTFNFNGDGTFDYTAYYVEGKDTKKVFDDYTFTFDEETLILNMSMSFDSNYKKDYFEAIKDGDGNISSFKALMDIDPHNGSYTIKKNTVFKLI